MSWHDVNMGYSRSCPCKGCSDRVLGCHASCGAYKNFKGEVDRVNRNRAEYMRERTLDNQHRQPGLPGFGPGSVRVRHSNT